MNRPAFRPEPPWSAQGTAFAVRGPVAVETAAYLRKVYLLFTGGVFAAIGGALVALHAGTPATLGMGEGSITVPPVVAFGLQHAFLAMAIYLAVFFGASFARRVPGLNVVALFGYAFVTGLFVAPAVFVAQIMSAHSLDPSPVRDAFLLTGAAFTGLTGYALVSKKDFSFLRGALVTGLWVVIGASLLGIFLHAEVFHLAIASVAVLLFAGFILYDTSRLLRSGDRSDPVGAALGLFLDVVNLFVSLLRILSSARDR